MYFFCGQIEDAASEDYPSLGHETRVNLFFHEEAVPVPALELDAAEENHRIIEIIRAGLQSDGCDIVEENRVSFSKRAAERSCAYSAFLLFSSVGNSRSRASER